jgi:hypothetical protein
MTAAAMAIGALVWTGLTLAAIPALLTLANLPRFRRAPPLPGGDGARRPAVSVLVPARNEAAAIGRLCRDVLSSEGVAIELVVLDDGSDDDTVAIVRAIAAADPRVRLVAGRPLPPGWCGKQHACWQLASAARHDTWVFCDVDVVPARDAVARSAALLEARGAALVSGFPRQETGAILDWLLLPLIHFILLGYLPLARSRETNAPGMAAGCGQWFVTRRDDYHRAGGHEAIRASLHDGVKLPRAYRRAGLATDVFDAGDIASCRMYDTSAAVWQGLAKNATEGIGSPATILPFTILLGGGQVLPAALVAWGFATGFHDWPQTAVPAALAALVLASLPRFVAAWRFGQSWSSALVHPLAVAVFLAIQWIALVRKLLGLKTTWRGRRLAPQ